MSTTADHFGSTFLVHVGIDKARGLRASPRPTCAWWDGWRHKMSQTYPLYRTHGRNHVIWPSWTGKVLLFCTNKSIIFFLSLIFSHSSFCCHLSQKMLVKEVATKCNTAFFNISAYSIVSKWQEDRCFQTLCPCPLLIWFDFICLSLFLTQEESKRVKKEKELMQTEEQLMEKREKEIKLLLEAENTFQHVTGSNDIPWVALLSALVLSLF